MTNTKAVLLNFDPPYNVNPPDGYLLAYQAATGFWVGVNVPLGINRTIHSTILVGGSPYAVLTSDDFIPVDSTGGPVTITLPSSPIVGKGYTVTDISGAASTNSITVSGNGHNIAGSGTYILNAGFQTVTVVFNGTNWTKV